MIDTQRRAWVWLAVVGVLVQYGSLIYSIAWHVGRPSGGVFPHAFSPSELEIHLYPVTSDAVRVWKEAGRPLRIEAVNGHSVCEDPGSERCGVRWARSLLDTRPGSENQVVVSNPGRGPEREVTFRAGPGEWRVVVHSTWKGLAIGTLGLLYVLVGLIVWLARPRDPASFPLLLFSLATAAVLVGSLAVDPWTRWLGTASLSLSGMMMPLMFLLGHAFSTRRDASRTARFRLQLAGAVVIGLLDASLRALLNLGVGAVRNALEIMPVLIGMSAVVSISLTLQSVWRAARPPSPLAQRRRAVVFAHAVILGFAYPTLWLLFRPIIIDSGHDQLAFVGLLVSFTAFPLLLGYAIVRHRMFDLRIVVRQGLVYSVLSVGLTLVYLALVVSAYRVLGAKHSGVAVAASFCVAIGFGVARVRIERAIDRLVFSGRAVFRSAIETAGRGLSRARTPTEVASALRPALMEALGLSRGYVVVVSAQRDALRFYLVASEEDAESGKVPPGLPEASELDRFSVISECLSADAAANAFDSDAMGAGEDFWEQFGLESAVPFGLVERDVRGVLLLGPKRSGRPFDPEDTALVKALCDQVSLALDNARAFEKLALQNRSMLQLTQGIVHEANTPLGVLASSLDTLARSLERLEPSQDPAARARTLGVAKTSASAAQDSEQRLRELIEGLKDYVNLEEAELRVTDLRRCLEDATSGLPLDAAKRVKCRLPEQPAQVLAYPAKLRQVLVNLLGNAIEASGNEQTVRAELSREGDRYRLVIADEGAGISKEALSRLFEFGLSVKRSQKRIGLRLGLPYARRVIEELDGHLSVKSKVGEGTEVTLELPVFGTSSRCAPMA